MTKKDFLRVISFFLQDPEAITSDRSHVVFANGDAEYSVQLVMAEGEVNSVIDRDGKTSSPKDWIATRLAHLDQLATAILRQYQHDAESMKYVPVASSYCDASGIVRDVADTEQLLKEQLQAREQCQTSVFFITSEAGDGKTILMRRMAVKSAQAFLQGDQNWLFVPVELGGKPFFRLDEFILGSLSRTYRFPLFIDAFVELVKCGRIVLALDGFEESAIQGADGEIISSLGSLLASLDSQGSVVFASRKAFYFHSHLHDYKSFASLASSYDVSIEEIGLKTWGRQQIMGLSKLYGLDCAKAGSLCDQLFNALGESSPLLSRAVLAHKFIRELVCDSQELDIETIVARFRSSDEDVLLHDFISYLLERETGKLIRSDADVTPILPYDGHERVLLMIAEEMWKTDADTVNRETLDTIIGLIVEPLRLTPEEYNRCRSHFPHHAMMKRVGESAVGFCHVDFYQHFLGVALAQALLHWTDSSFDVQKILDRKPLPVISLRECIRRVVGQGQQSVLSPRIAKLVEPSQRDTPLGQNITALRLMLHGGIHDPLELKGVYCPEFAMRSRYLTNVTLVDSIIECCDLALMAGSDVRLIRCELTRARYIGNQSLRGTTFDAHSVPRVLVRSERGEKADIGDMSVIRTLLQRAGANILGSQESVQSEEFEDDDLSAIFFKVVGLFDMRTFLTENVLKNRLGMRYSSFEMTVCPQMLKCGVLAEKDYHGRHDQRMFRLVMNGDRIMKARSLSRGSFDVLIAKLESEVG